MATNLGTLSIGEHTFRIRDATVSAALPQKGPLEWFVEVVARPAKFGGEAWAPRAYIERYPSKAASMDELLSSPLVIRDGAAFSRNRLFPGSRLCCLYVFEHEHLKQSEVVFEKGRGNRLKLHWTAKCAVHFDREYDDNLDLRIETDAYFLGISIGAATEDQAYAALSRHFDCTGFRYHLERGQPGSYYLPIAGKW